MAENVLPSGRTIVQEIEFLYSILPTATHYQLLRIRNGATEDEIRKSYRMLARDLHPDRHRAGLPEEQHQKLSEVFGQITTAYNTLTDPDARAEYDEWTTIEPDPHTAGYTTSERQAAERLYTDGLVAFKKKDILRAISIFEQLVAIMPDNPEYLAKLALAQLAVPKFRNAARESIARAIELNRENAHYQAIMGRVLLKQKKHEEADIYLRRALSWNPRHRAAREALKEIEEYRESVRQDTGTRLKRFLKRLKGDPKPRKSESSEQPRELRSRLAHEPRRRPFEDE